MASAESEPERECRLAEASFSAQKLLGWLTDCLAQHGSNSHRDCQYLQTRERIEARSLPKRLLDVGFRDRWPCTLKLVKTTNLVFQETKYAALSHVWGSLTDAHKKAMSTTVFSEKSHHYGISLADIPLQYRAVVTLCRCLHIRYLWIDSLCIIQGPGGDWEEESTKMASTYGSATVTITVNTTQNLICSPLFGITHDLKTPPAWERAYDKCVDEDRAAGTTVFAMHNFHKFLCEGGIIGDRAWCLQERQLSPRVIHLLDNGVAVWECSTLLAKMATPSHFPFMHRLVATRFCAEWSNRLAAHERYSNARYYRQPQQDYLDPVPHLQIWHTILRNMGYRNLTYHSDNLTAIAGVAEQVYQNTGLRYYSGIWEEDIPRGLMWARFSSGASHGQTWKRFRNYQGPSWSWCSVDGQTQLIGFNQVTSVPIKLAKMRNTPSLTWGSLIEDARIEASPKSNLSRHVTHLADGSFIALHGHIAPFEYRGPDLDSLPEGKEFIQDRLSGGSSGNRTPMFTWSSARYHDIDQSNGRHGSQRCIDQKGDHLNLTCTVPGLHHVRGSGLFDISEYNPRFVWCLCLAEAPRRIRGYRVAMMLEPFDPATNQALVVDTLADLHRMLICGFPNDFRRVGLAVFQSWNSIPSDLVASRRDPGFDWGWPRDVDKKIMVRIF